MSLEQQILIQQLIVPALLGVTGGYLILLAPEVDDWEPPYFSHSVSRLLPGGLIGGLGLLVADFWKRGLLTSPSSWATWSHKNQWEWLVFLVPISVVLMCLLRSLITKESSWARVSGPVALIIGWMFLYFSLGDLVQGDKWKPMFLWLVVGAIAMTTNLATFDEMSASGAERWCGLILVGQLVCIAVFGIQSYMSLAQWTLSLAGLALGATIASGFRPRRSETVSSWSLNSLFFPLIASIIPTLFATQSFAFEKLPFWLLSGILFLPTIVWGMDILYTRTCRMWVRILWAFLICAGVLLTIILLTKPFESEW